MNNNLFLFQQFHAQSVPTSTNRIRLAFHAHKVHINPKLVNYNACVVQALLEELELRLVQVRDQQLIVKNVVHQENMLNQKAVCAYHAVTDTINQTKDHSLV